jgi:eukaryotic-like serine/threonine-protein kinase
MHSLLNRQIEKFFRTADMIPESYRPFVSAIDRAYEEADTDRRMLERSLEISSQEMIQSYEEMRLLQGKLETRVEERTAELFEANKSLHARVQELAALQKTALEIASSTNSTTLLESIVRRSAQLLEASSGGLYLCASDRQELRLSVTYNMLGEYVGTTLQYSEGVAGKIAQTGEPLIINDYRSWSGRAMIYEPDQPFNAVLGVPLIWQNQIIGVIDVVRDAGMPPFLEADLDLLTLFAYHAVIAIENTRLLDETQRLAITDDLTGLYNRRHFLELANREFDQACRYGKPLSAVFLDLDNYKQVNDSHGHAVGDEVLRAVAARCLSQLRKVDILGRYGGEEFVAFFPETNLDGVNLVAERLRRKVAVEPIDTRRGPLAVTISLGIATLDESCTTLDILLDRADQGVYSAKQAGRNQVGVWQP